MVKSITRDELRAKIERGDDFVLIETLPAKSYAHGHLPGAVNLPVEDVRTRAAELIPDLDAEVVLYCASLSCDASTKASRLLERLGYTNLFDYHHGKADWKEAGLPMEAGPAG
jgi:rhodanese-related sulfurtransferase